MAGRWVMASIQTSFAIMPAAVYWVGGLALAGGSTAITIPMLVAFTTLQTRLFFPVGSLLGVGLDVQTSLALFDRIFEYLDEPVDIAEKPDALGGRRGRRRRLRPRLVPLRRGLDAAGRLVHGAARDDDRARRRDRLREDDARLSRRAAVRRRARRRSRSTASTCATSASRALSDLVGVVSQETYLFHASVRENLRFAKPDATDEEIEAAAEAARIHHVIAALPEGYDTVVGERGYRFSGGEKQRIAIARTILRNPPILVLDEATSSLDTETERLVQEALDRLSEGRTTIAIAHRLSTVRDADQIVVLDHGRVVEQGRHEDLLLAGGRYTTLAARDAELVGA